MLTEFIFSLLKDNYKIFIILDVFRDVFLFLIFVFAFGEIIISLFYRGKLNLIYLIELVTVITLVISISQIISHFFPSLRPISYFSALTEQKLDSLPSRHSALSFGISFVTLISNFQLGLMLFIFSLWVAILSWLSLMHWPIDIIIGIIIALISTALTVWFTQFLLRFNIKKTKTKI